MTNRQPSRQLTVYEWIILLDVYLSHKDSRLTPKHPEIVKASAVLNALEKIDGASPVSFRPPSGLHRQIRMFERLEVFGPGDRLKIPARAATVWEQYAEDPVACRRAADDIRSRASPPNRL